jgi:hypothetical protein
MTKEEELWNRFKEIEIEISHLKFIIQNPISEYPLRPDDITSWQSEAKAAIEHLKFIVTKTDKFVNS